VQLQGIEGKRSGVRYIDKRRCFNDLESVFECVRQYVEEGRLDNLIIIADVDEDDYGGAIVAWWRGDMRLTSAMGMLEFAKHDIFITKTRGE